jgi:hypothetical protein
VTPAILIRLAIEARPSVAVDAMDEGEFVRLIDWLEANPELRELLFRALELERGSE